MVALKYAQRRYGADGHVADLLVEAGESADEIAPRIESFRLVCGRDAVKANRVLFVGVPPLRHFDYAQIRAFSKRVLAVLARAAPDTTHVAVTIHGPGYGLDEIEAFHSAIAGFLEAFEAGEHPLPLARVSVVERNRGRAERLAKALSDLPSLDRSTKSGRAPKADPLQTAGYESGSKSHAFVAMPFREEMDDLYHYGIQAAVRDAGYLCERADLSVFTGDVMEWVRERIRSAKVVVADLSEQNPNVYLEVGFAWGCGVPTVLLKRVDSEVTFDVRGQRYLEYRSIRDLEQSLRENLKPLAS